eukprot:621724-Rhodomonas_salina.1
MGEAHGLVGVVDLDSIPLEPGHAQDEADALQGQNAEHDVAFVLAVNVHCGGRLVQDREEGTIGKADGAHVRERDQRQSQTLGHIMGDELAMGAVVHQR